MTAHPKHPMTRNHRRRAVLLLTATLGGLAVTDAACSSGTAGGSGSGRAAATGAPAPAAAVVSTSPSSLGAVLSGTGGRTLYLFERDRGTASTCTGACASLWPPLTTSGPPTATGLARAHLLGTTRRPDGTAQVTYAGHPLYYFAGDHAAGDVIGEGLKNFGAGWYVLAPSGNKIDRD